MGTTTTIGSNFNITVTAAIDNDSILKLLVMFVVLIILFFLFKKIMG